MARKKVYTPEDLVSSYKDKDIELPFRDGVIKIRLKAINAEQYFLLARAASGSFSSRALEITREFTRPLRVDRDGKVIEEEWKDEVWKKLPPGFLVTLQDELFSHLGFTVSVEDLKKMYGSTLVEEE